MYRVCACALLGAMLSLSSGLVGQEPKKEAKKDDPKATKKDEPAGKFKGQLPANWKKLGLSDQQVQDVYKIQSKYNEEIDKLDAKIKELKATMDKERRAVLTPEQKKRLEEILIGKDK
jgi:Spy/CpxP family protein refolding chaperone